VYLIFLNCHLPCSVFPFATCQATVRDTVKFLLSVSRYNSCRNVVPRPRFSMAAMMSAATEQTTPSIFAVCSVKLYLLSGLKPIRLYAPVSDPKRLV